MINHAIFKETETKSKPWAEKDNPLSEQEGMESYCPCSEDKMKERKIFTGDEIYKEILEYSDVNEKHELSNVKFIKQKDLEFFIKRFNGSINKYETDEYFSKKHLLDYVDSHLSAVVDYFKLSIED